MAAIKTRLARTLAAIGCCLTMAHPAAAAPFMIVGLDQKQTWNNAGERILFPTGKDLVAIIDLAQPEAPRIVGTLPLENSVAGPPVNVAISPDNQLALVADSYTVVPNGEGLQIVPTNKLFVIDLSSAHPKLAQTLAIGSQPSGLSINSAGTLALVGYRSENAVGVLKIERGRVREIGRISMNDSISHVAFTPDGRHAIAVKHETHKVSMLSVDADRVTDDHQDIATSPGPYVVEVTPNGRLGLSNDHNFVTVIDLQAQPPQALDKIPVAEGAEGFAVSPRGNIAVSVSLRASNGNKGSPAYHETGAMMVLRIDGTKLTPIKTFELGRVPEAVAFTPDGRNLYVGNFADNDLWVFRVNGTEVTDTGKRFSLPGHPASARITPASFAEPNR